MKYTRVKLNNKNFYIGTEGETLVWADWEEPEGDWVKSDPVLDRVLEEFAEYLRGERKKFSISLKPEGTDFQKRVWNELIKIPWGVTVSYSEIAKKIGSPSSVRAVASAIGRNPIAVFIPCHRVLAKGGKLGGFSGGLPTKRYLLKIEGYTFNKV